MPEEREEPRPHGTPLENAIQDNPEQNRVQSQGCAKIVSGTD